MPTHPVARYGLPHVGRVIDKGRFVVGYNPGTRSAIYVAECLKNIRCKSSGVQLRKPPRFYEEPNIPPQHRIKRSDFRNSPYNIGHLAAAGNYKESVQDKLSTYVLSNTVPQDPVLNATTWNNLEQWTRGITGWFDEVMVVTGPLYVPRKYKNHKIVRYEVIGDSGIAVPTHLFKVILGERNNRMPYMAGFIVPNKRPKNISTPIWKYQVPVQKIEQISGLIFFEQMNLHVARELKGRIKRLDDKGV